MRAVVCVGAVLCALWVLAVIGSALTRRTMERRVIPYLDGGIASAFDRPVVAALVHLWRAAREPRLWPAGLANVLLLLIGTDVAAELSDREVRHAVEDGIAEQQRLARESQEEWARKRREHRHEEEDR